MDTSLDEVKRVLSDEYLGKGGLHAVGVRRSSNAVAVYTSAPDTPERRAVIDEVRDRATPYPVIVVEEGAPRAG